MVQLTIDPFFRDKIPPLSESEFSQLRENIIEDGEVYEPIVVWGNTIIDGHNRWRIICENWELLKDKFKTKAVDFPDKWSAAEWMYKKQLGRRNLSLEQRDYAIGKMYEARKRSHGGTGANQYKSEQSGQNDQSAKPNNTSDAIAKEIGVGEATVRRAERFAKGVDALRDVSPEAADKVLSGRSGISKSAVAGMVDKNKSDLKTIAEEIVTGEVKKTRSHNPKGWGMQDRKSREETEAIIADMLDPSTVPEFTVEMLIDDIRLNAENYTSLLRNTLVDHAVLITGENRPKIAEAIEVYLIVEIEKVRNLLK